jgi:hypothetical protein
MSFYFNNDSFVAMSSELFDFFVLCHILEMEYQISDML